MKTAPSLANDLHPAPARTGVKLSKKSLAKLIASAGIDLRQFCDSFEDILPSSDSADARQFVSQFKTWLSQNAGDHPFLKLQLITTAEALASAGIALDSNFSTETAAHERDGNDDCPDDQAKWFTWLDRVGALHICDWGDDEASLIDAICAAVRANAPILVLELLG
jgi:hypothetical protein